MSLTKKIGVAVAISVYTSQGNPAYLVSQRKSGKYKDLWHFTGGHVEDGETLEEAAKREAMEETGLDVVIGNPLLTYIDYEGDFICTIFAAQPTEVRRVNDDLPDNPEPEKHSDWIWVDAIPSPRFKGLDILVDRGILLGQI